MLVVVASDAPVDFLERFARLLREQCAHPRQLVWSRIVHDGEARMMVDVAPDALGDHRLIESVRTLPGVKDVNWMDQVYPRRR